MHIDVPLHQLVFGQEDGAGINARVSGRLDGIEALAANLHAQGQIEDLIVKPFGDLYSVSNGNRRLAAFHLIHGKDSDHLVGCTLHEVDEAKAFEFSLTTAVTARQLHPVDQYEAFARLEQLGKTNEEIAQQYGMTEKEVRQALALGRLSPTIRDAWRKGDVRTEAAKAFTLGLDHKTQDKVFAKLSKEGRLWESTVIDELGGADVDVGELLDFIGAESYRDAGGTVVEDLFGSAHVVSDPAMLKQMAATKLSAACEHLRSEGWSWAELLSDLPNGARWWSKSQPKAIAYEGDEESRVTQLRAEIAKIEAEDEADEDGTDVDALNARRVVTESEFNAIEEAALRRSFTARQKAKAGCIVALERGRLSILFGALRPETSKPSAGSASAQASKTKGAADALDEPAISQALAHRLTVQLTKGAATALMQDPDLGLCVMLAGMVCYFGSGVSLRNGGLGAADLDIGSKDMPAALAMVRKLTPQQRMEMTAQFAAAALDFQNMPLDHAKGDAVHGPRAICNAIDAKTLNAALRGAFDAKDYFAGVSKALTLKAIEDACGADLARQQSKNSKPDIVKFAVANVPATGWLPTQLRAKGYDGPPIGKINKALPAAKAKPVKAAAKKAAQLVAKRKTAKKKK